MICRHWIGDERRFCESTVDVRRYKDGDRCPEHSPAAIRKAEDR